jgi:HSP20 family protein
MMMRSVSPWLSWKTLDQLHQEMNELFGNLSEHTPNLLRYPPVRIYHNSEEVLVTAELPGFDIENLNISVNGQQLSLSGNRTPEKLPEGTVRHLDERGVESFQRVIKLPFAVSPQGAEAKYDKGILTVKLIRPEEEKPHRIAVQKG